MKFHGARFGLWGEKIDSWEQNSEIFRELYPVFRAPGLPEALPQWPPCEIQFPEPFDGYSMTWLPFQGAALAFFSVAGIGVMAHCALASGRGSDHLALAALHEVLVAAWEAAGPQEVRRDILDYAERPAILLVSWGRNYPDDARKVNSFAHCLAARYFEELEQNS